MSVKKADEDEGAEVVADDDLAEMELEDDADVEAEGWRVGDVSAETPRRRRRCKRRHVDGRQGNQKETPEGTTHNRVGHQAPAVEKHTAERETASERRK